MFLPNFVKKKKKRYLTKLFWNKLLKFACQYILPSPLRTNNSLKAKHEAIEH